MPSWALDVFTTLPFLAFSTSRDLHEGGAGFILAIQPRYQLLGIHSATVSFRAVIFVIANFLPFFLISKFESPPPKRLSCYVFLEPR